ncbi:Dual specificity protein kinase shkC [Stylophora pistillata]|uniref:Dual specificity protein kinase shkC n=1 Tax=Stylophora pistillata TaxID=50429 RepID=A0A2B4S672_STYPI|nr:Dual specificity protein kinase shkC [Stylophora pistillata]
MPRYRMRTRYPSMSAAENGEVPGEFICMDTSGLTGKRKDRRSIGTCSVREGKKSREVALLTRRKVALFLLKDFFAAGGDVSITLPSEKVTIARSNLIGRGSTSRVYKGEYKEEQLIKHVVAIKEFVAPLTRKSHRKLDHEAKVLTKLSHPNVLRFFGRVNGSSSLVSKYLGKVIYNAKGETIEVNNVRQLLDEQVEEVPWAVRLHMALEAAKGLSYLHEAGCVHCDFKSSNVFIGGDAEKMEVKIGDFGESILDAKEVITTQMSSQELSRGGGTMPFVAFEILKGGKPSTLSDIYSFGMFLVELLVPSWSNPWDGVCRPMLIPSKVLANERPTLPSYLDGLLPDILDSYTDLIKKCWVQNPKERPSSLAIVRELESIRTRISSPKITDPKVSSNSLAEDVKFRFPENTDDVQHHILNLSIHQGSVMETFGEITASCAREGTEFDSDLTADISAKLQMLDGSRINPNSAENFTIVDTHCVPKSVGGNENAAVVQINHTSVEKAVSHLAKWMEMRLENSGVGNVQNCMDTLLHPSNSEIGPELTDTYLRLEDEKENESLCNALEDSISEMESSVTNMENDCERFVPCDNQKIEEDTKDASEEGEPWRNKHYLLKIREQLAKSTNWFAVKEKSAYEYPGFDVPSDRIGHCPDPKKTGIGSCQRPHFMWHDCQLTKRGTSTKKVHLKIDNVNTEKGHGIGFIPAEKSPAASNPSRNRRERQMVLEGRSRLNPNIIPLVQVLEFEDFRKEYENRHDSVDEEFLVKLNGKMGKYQMEGREYLLSPSRNFAFFLAPYQAELLKDSKDLYVDITYTNNSGFPYLLNMVAFNEITLNYNEVARVLLNKQDGDAYATAISEVFGHVTKIHPSFKNGHNLRQVMVDFDQAEYNGFERSMGMEVTEKIMRGCMVHWKTSVNRVSDIVTKSKEEYSILRYLGHAIQDVDQQADVRLAFDGLCGKKSVIHAKHLLSPQLAAISNQINNCHWSKSAHWVKWWSSDRILNMFCKAFTLRDTQDWESTANINNLVESLNRQSIGEGCSNISVLMKNIYLHTYTYINFISPRILD